MIDWFPVVAVIFKVLVLGTGMYFAIKWHYDQGKKGKQKDRGAVLRNTAIVAVVFVLSLLGLVYVTFAVAKRLGLDLSLP